MSPSRTDDYILRQIEIAGQMLARALGRRLAGAHDDARATLAQTYELLLGPQQLLIQNLDVGTAASCLGSPEMTMAYARLVREEALQEADAGRRASLLARAVDLATLAAQQYPDDEDLARARADIAHTDGEA